MNKKSVRKFSALLLFSASIAMLAACTPKTEDSKAEANDDNTLSHLTETEESKINKGMDNLPEASYWFPEDLLQWDFASDPDAKYNVSKIPLAERVAKEDLPTSNETQDPDMKVVALSIMNSSTSGNAPHGINDVNSNVFSYWQYIDQLIYWGGSSGEGIIVPPSADVIDAAHKNGTPVLGTIFFPQVAHGGKIEWLNTFLEKDADGNFPIIEKLIEVANVYGFDGWFVNQETDTEDASFENAEQGVTTDAAGGLNKEHADLMKEFIAQFKETNDELELMWYDSMTNEGKMDWQNALTDKNSDYLVDADLNPLADSMFLNFWWNSESRKDQELLKASKEKAESLKINPYDLYAGIDVQENGYMTPVDWNLFMDENGKPYTSLGLYAPSWTFSSAGSLEDFQAKEDAFWVNDLSNPTLSVKPNGDKWPGISTFAVEQTAITQLPFVTNFNLGNGYNYFIDGTKVSNMDWNNRSMQDILPTYRWLMDHQDSKNDLKASYDYTQAYIGGNSLKFRGTMEKDQASILKLYATQLTLEKDTVFTTTAKATENTTLELVLEYEDGTSATFAGDKKIAADWTTTTFDVSKAVGKVITSISYSISSEADSTVYDFNLGQLSANAKPEKVDLKVTDVSIEDAIFDEEESNYAGVRLTWAVDQPDKTNYFEIYRINEDDTRSFIGVTPALNHYINALERNDDTNKTNFEIVPVDYFGVRGNASAEITMDWPDNSVPKADFTASRTLLAPGEKVTFTNTSSTNTESVKWAFEGGDITESTNDAPVVTYDKAGVYAVTMTAINDKGETPLEVKGLITVTEDAAGDLALLSANVPTEASGFTNDGEAPEMANDGIIDTKWCAVGTPPHELTMDLGADKTISEVHLAHAEAGGESPDMNTRAFAIEVSSDGVNFTRVSRVINNTAAESVHTFAAVEARYVKIIVDKPTQGSDSAVRIYEMGVYGLE
ncbi:endo-beta-N-acetylglucosaminidase [Enterococcus timonensis]|uniref:endo-beta-N-acetylglucosaminidase n=1 Tax=Enterococcus timonensis TaxID=1852364 RepID=UPI0008DAACC8|nr:discoidin domain-containing protein [Enterococcus timonensis]